MDDSWQDMVNTYMRSDMLQYMELDEFMRKPHITTRRQASAHRVEQLEKEREAAEAAIEAIELVYGTPSYHTGDMENAEQRLKRVETALNIAKQAMRR